jgi:hypothetical protein
MNNFKNPVSGGFYTGPSGPPSFAILLLAK